MRNLIFIYLVRARESFSIGLLYPKFVNFGDPFFFFFFFFFFVLLSLNGNIFLNIFRKADLDDS